VEEVRSGKVMVIFSDDVRMESGRILERQLQVRAPGSTVFYVDPRIAIPMTDEVLRAVDEAESVIAAVYAVPSAGRAIQGKNGPTNTVSLAEQSGALLQKILDRATAKTVVLAMGNPYLAQEFPVVENYLCTFSNASVSEVSAAKAIFGEIPIRGRLPVTIPNIAQRGGGLDRPALTANGVTNHAQSSH
jgi:beta-N-acetylhexosaminidase